MVWQNNINNLLIQSICFQFHVLFYEDIALHKRSLGLDKFLFSFLRGQLFFNVPLHCKKGQAIWHNRIWLALGQLLRIGVSVLRGGIVKLNKFMLESQYQSKA